MLRMVAIICANALVRVTIATDPIKVSLMTSLMKKLMTNIFCQCDFQLYNFVYFFRDLRA